MRNGDHTDGQEQSGGSPLATRRFQRAMTKRLPESGRPDSNRRRPAWEAGILPTELRPRVIGDPATRSFTPTAGISPSCDVGGRPTHAGVQAPAHKKTSGEPEVEPREHLESHWSDLNRRPLDYESSALPLSYSGNDTDTIQCPDADSNRDAFRHSLLKTACLPVSPPGRLQRSKYNGADGARTRDLSSDSRVL